MPAKPFKIKSRKKLELKRKKTELHNAAKIEAPKKHSKKQKTEQNSKADEIRKLQLKEANQAEDKTIKRMEKLLKLNKKKKKLHASFKEEGLDYILGAIEGKDGERLLSDDSDAMEEDLAAVRGGPSTVKSTKRRANFQSTERPQPKKRTLSELLHEKEGISSDKDEEQEESDRDSISEAENSGEEDDSSCDVPEDGDSREEDCSSEGSSDENEVPGEKGSEKTKTWEDIYGRIRDSQGNVLQNPGKNLYVPPKLRKECSAANDESKQEICLKIKRQLKGLLNRLSESNLQNISHQIEEMYMKYSRNDMNEAIFLLMSELLFTAVLTPPRLMIEQAMLVALLHTNVGPEVGAYFLQHIVKRLGELFTLDSYGEEKECNNVLVFLSHLYNFKVTHSTLIFDLFRILIESFDTKDVELIQLLLKNIGFVMRKDDPLQLKELILSIQNKASQFDRSQNDSRVRFMLEILTAIRNNNMYKIPDYDPTIIEHCKKLLRGVIRKGCSIQELNISYADLLKAEERGRWWIVGSAWAESNDGVSRSFSTVKGNPVLPKTEVSEKISELARKQHMNTDVRKSVFDILMTAEDCMDAFEKLLKLNLKNQQQREIIHVILHCALQEKTYNPYYALLAEKFCSFARKHQMCLQYSLWDKFKELSKMKSHQLKNLSHFMSHLFTSDALPLSILKVIHFSEMDKTMIKFFRQILLSVLLHDSEEVCARAFTRIAAAENLELLRESLRLFMRHFVLRNHSKVEPEVASKLKARVKLAENSLKAFKRIF